MFPEVIIARESANLLKRDPLKYIRGVAGMYLLSFKAGFETGSVFRSAYYLVRHIDDVLDGDRQISGDPLAYVQDLRHQIESGIYNKKMGMGLLARHAVNSLESKAKPGDAPRVDFLNAIDEIIFDYQRTQDRTILTEEELEKYFRRAFDPVINLTLVGLNSTLRSPDLPAMSYGQGRVYSARDLKTDWERGTLNVPREVLRVAGLKGESSYSDVLASVQVTKWFLDILGKTKPDLLAVHQGLKNSPSEKLAFLICGGLINPMIRFIDHHEAQTSTRSTR